MQTNRLAENLKQLKGTAIASIDSKTIVKLAGGKKNPLQGKIEKLVKGSSIMLFTNKLSNGYVAMVKRRLEKEGKDPNTFKVSPRLWGERLSNSCVVQHKGELYLEAIHLKPPKSVTYLCEGSPIKKELVVGLPKATSNAGSQGNLEDKVKIRTYKLNSIVNFRCGELSVNTKKEERV